MLQPIPKPVRRMVARVPGAVGAFSLATQPGETMRRWKEARAFAAAYGPVLRPRPGVQSRGTVLLVSLAGGLLSIAKTEAFLGKSMQLHGLEPVVLTTRSSPANAYYRLHGIERFVHIEDFLDPAAPPPADVDVASLLAGVRTFDDLMALRFESVGVGKYICSTLVRKTYTGEVNLQDPATRERLAKLIPQALVTTRAAQAIFRYARPDAALFLERGYSPYGELFDVALGLGVNTMQWCGSHRDSALTLKRYHAGNTDKHPASLSPQTWRRLKALPWGPQQAEAMRGELHKNYASGAWFSEVGTQTRTKLMESERVREMLGLDPRKKTAVLFSHLFWDATFFWGEDLFDNYRQWYMEAVKAACRNDRLNWVIKMHPANIVKLARDGYTGELVERTAIRETVGELPPHVRLLEPETPISTYSLFDVMDYCLTVRGTIGIESAAFGVRVLTAGTGRYDHHGFTIDSDSREAYLQRLARLEECPSMTPEEIELAERFAYGTFLARPFELRSMRISYRKDAKATQEIGYNVRSAQELWDAPDTRAFGAWAVDSRDEDYLEFEPAAAVGAAK